MDRVIGANTGQVEPTVQIFHDLEAQGMAMAAAPERLADLPGGRRQPAGRPRVAPVGGEERRVLEIHARGRVACWSG